jgi:SAM-dependent methyltransferase
MSDLDWGEPSRASPSRLPLIGNAGRDRRGTAGVPDERDGARPRTSRRAGRQKRGRTRPQPLAGAARATPSAMKLGDFLRPRLLDWGMRQLDELRADVLRHAEGEVLEVGLGTGLNLPHYPPAVKAVVGLDPLAATDYARLRERVESAAFPVETRALPADAGLPFDAGRFDCVVTTWTLCSIPDARAALAEMRRVLKPGGRYVFVEHGRAPAERTARWQDRLDPVWSRIADGCHMNRPIDALVGAAGFELRSVERFRHKGPALLAHMFRGVAARA